MTTEPFTVETTRLRDGCYIIVLEYWVIQKKSKSVENYICLYICVFVCVFVLYIYVYKCINNIIWLEIKYSKAIS